MMRTRTLIATGVAAVVLTLPGWALADGGRRPTDPGAGHQPPDAGAAHANRDANSDPSSPRADAPPAEHAKAYGKFCQHGSKKHAAGQKGTPFSQCVTAMTKLASGEADTARQACKALSHKHVRGQK